MNIAVLDTSGIVCSCAIGTEDRLLSEVYQHNKLNHSAVLLPLFSQTLEQADLKTGDIDLFAVCVGPGSFTGLRIGVATAQAFAAATNKPIAALDTLDLLAENGALFAGQVVSLIDARNERVYYSCYTDGIKQTEDAVAPLNDVCAQVGETRTLFVGDGAICYREQIAAHCKNAVFAPANLCYPRASSGLALAIRHQNKGALLAPHQLKINYMVKPQAEREREREQSNG